MADDTRERYSLGYGAASDLMADRSLYTQAGFFLHHLRSGSDLLDCGCGPGTITLGLAEEVAPGQVVGIDIEESQITRAEALAVEKGVSNVQFEVASAFELPFEDNSFDILFSNNMLEHVSSPLAAIKEMHRVLKSGGVIGVRATAHRKDIVEPDNPWIDKYWAIIEEMYRLNGSDPRIGGRLRGLLREAGFFSIEASASYNCPSTPDEINLWVRTALTPTYVEDRAIELGLTDRSEYNEIKKAWIAWGEHPDAFMARARGEAVGWKE